jgi:hypothetical protein
MRVIHSGPGLTKMKMQSGYSSRPGIDLTSIPRYEYYGLLDSVDC